MATTRALTLATAHGMIKGVHGHATNLRPIALPAIAAGFAKLLAFVLIIADLTNAGPAFAMKLTYFPGRQFDRHIFSFLGHKLRRNTGAPYKLRSLADLHLNIMDNTAKGHVAHRQTIARFDVNRLPGNYDIAHFNPERRKDVSLFAVKVREQSQIGRTVRVIFDGRDLRRDINFFPFEINDPVLALVAAPDMPRGNTAVVVASTCLA